MSSEPTYVEIHDEIVAMDARPTVVHPDPFDDHEPIGATEPPTPLTRDDARGIAIAFMSMPMTKRHEIIRSIGLDPRSVPGRGLVSLAIDAGKRDELIAAVRAAAPSAPAADPPTKSPDDICAWCGAPRRDHAPGEFNEGAAPSVAPAPPTTTEAHDG